MSYKKVKKWLVHTVANCHDCNWEEGDYLIAQKEARNHAIKTGHMVSIETTYAQIYNEK